MRRAHLIGAGGAGMQSLAAVLAAQGWALQGSDDRPRHDEGATPAVGWQTGRDPRRVDGACDLVVYSDAVAADHCERLQAADNAIPQLSYPQMLAELMLARQGIAVAGTHGKSTTTAMTAACLHEAGIDPMVIFGATWRDGRPGGSLGRHPMLLVEACEYRRNFLRMTPWGAAVLNVEADHFDCYRDVTEVLDAFAEFVWRLPADGWLVLGTDCPRAAGLANRARCRVATSGLRSGTWRAEPRGTWHQGRTTFRLCKGSRLIGDVTWSHAGEHQLRNAAAAAALAGELGASAAAICRGLESFPGLARRGEFLGDMAGIALWDDYAHHPTAITATLAALRARYGPRRVVAVLEPHQSSRLAALVDEFARSLQNADRLWISDVFPARESGLAAAATAADLVARLRAQGATADRVESVDAVVDDLSCGDVCVTLGAGDVRKLAYGIAERLRRVCAA